MGDRVSVSFKHGPHESVALFSHWSGMGFVEMAKDYVAELKATLKGRNRGMQYPIDRLEPCTVMVDFIRHLTEDMKLVENNIYLGRDPNDGDNGDNGHYIIHLDDKEILP